MTLYEKIGQDTIRQAIENFYALAFADPMIGYFFRDLNKQELVEKQINFASSMLGAKDVFHGKDLRSAHKHLGIRSGHFGRRQVLMRQVLDQLNLDIELKEAWLAKEEALKKIVVGNSKNCTQKLPK